MATSEESSLPVPVSKAESSDGGPIVLIVDDSLTVRMDLAAAFEAAGFRLRLCGTAAEARAALAAEPISIAVLDVLLPDADGVDLLREIRESPSTSTLLILMLSTEGEVHDRVRGMQVGADDYVGKPYETHYLVARAKALLQGRERGTNARVTILIVDDSLTFREELRYSLERAGYAVLSASSGEEGLRVAAMHRPTALIVDGVLPGMDGATLIRRVQQDIALRGTPCLLLTASDTREAELQALDAGADAFMRKEGDAEVILARLAAVLRRSSPASRESKASSSPKRILVVDGNEISRREIARILRDEGYDVVVAHAGEAALEMLAVQPVDCVLLDLGMPGLGGKETCRRIKASPVLRDVPLIMVIAKEDRHATIESLAAGADDCIAKSSEHDVFKARLNAQLRRKHFEDEGRRRREEVLRGELLAGAACAARHDAEANAVLASELARKNQELEAFSYSVSHDLRAPVRHIVMFSALLLEEHAEALNTEGRDYLQRVRKAGQRMGAIIDDLMQLSQVGRAALRRKYVCISDIAQTVACELSRTDPDRKAVFAIRAGLMADADIGLVRVLFENLLGNAWKFTANCAECHIEFGATVREGAPTFFVRDNGAGFDMAHARDLFNPFKRLHTEQEFAGTGIGLATVRRIVDRHGGQASAEAKVGLGATIFFTLPSAPVSSDPTRS
jgi:DNA-binding response OmpR family regulator